VQPERTESRFDRIFHQIDVAEKEEAEKGRRNKENDCPNLEKLEAIQVQEPK